MITCLRSRGGSFLWVFAGQLLLQGVLMTVLFWSSILVTGKVIQMITA